MCGKEGGSAEQPVRLVEKDGRTMASFWIGIAVYDSKVPGQKRYTNWLVKAYGKAAEHIKVLNLKKGYHINLYGEVDQDTYQGESGTRILPVIKIYEWRDIELVYNSLSKTSGTEKNEEEKPRNVTASLAQNEVINLDEIDFFADAKAAGTIFD